MWHSHFCIASMNCTLYVYLHKKIYKTFFNRETSLSKIGSYPKNCRIKNNNILLVKKNIPAFCWYADFSNKWWSFFCVTWLWNFDDAEWKLNRMQHVASLYGVIPSAVPFMLIFKQRVFLARCLFFWVGLPTPPLVTRSWHGDPIYRTRRGPKLYYNSYSDDRRETTWHYLRNTWHRILHTDVRNNMSMKYQYERKFRQITKIKTVRI